jgi:CheY-like chemotaxis protein
LAKAMIETKEGWQVWDAVDGNDAIKKAVELKPDLVALDFAMGSLTGVQAAAKIAASCPNLPVILYTFLWV